MKLKEPDLVVRTVLKSYKGKDCTYNLLDNGVLHIDNHTSKKRSIFVKFDEVQMVITKLNKQS
jgi:hypothetical protein